jgi:hypothetical protein
MTVTVTRRRTAVTVRAYSVPAVREIPRVLPPGIFDSTW